ncbi:MAG: ABC transporter permease [Polyangia bacterium]
MNLFQTLRVALLALRRNMLRSFLTTLGMIFGVGAVVAMVAIGEGATAKIEAQFAAMGSNLLIVSPGSAQTGGVHGGAGTKQAITWEDLKAIRTELPSVRDAAADMRTNINVMSESQNWVTSVNGVTPEFLGLRAWAIDSGVAFGQAELDARAKVCVLGGTVVDKLFPGQDPIGQSVRIRNVTFLVTGTLERKGQSSWGQDYDDIILVPASSYQGYLVGGNQKYVTGMFIVGGRTTEGMARTEKDVTALLRQRHHIQDGGDDDFQIRNLTEIANQQQQEKQTMTMLLAGVALVSLLVGGIGIMNIMLVSVTERTREIGLRMAIGATPSRILLQFLVEALTLSVLGGLIGIVVGIGGAWEVARRIDWPLLIRADASILAVGFSGFVGLAFGIYPAYRASRLDPIEALRHE